jgi:hypothetical protein
MKRNSAKNKKLFIFSLNKLYPLFNGGAIAQYFFLQDLSEDFDCTLFYIVRDNSEWKNIDYVKKCFPKINFEVLNDSPKIYLRVLIYLGIKYPSLKKITSFIQQIITKSNHEDVLFKKVSKYLTKIFSDQEYDVIQFEFFETLKYANLIPNKTKKIFICHEIRFRKHMNEKILKSFDIAEIEKYELNQLRTFNSVVVFNTEDKEILQSKISNRISVSPFGIPQSLVKKHQPSKNFNRLIFLGSESHMPNKLGLKWFLDEIYLKSTISKWEIVITGKWSDDFKLCYSQIKTVKFIGLVENLENIYNESILVSPINSGSGIRTKILEAMANHIPVLGTHFSFEGLYLNSPNENFVVIKDLIDFDYFFSSKTYSLDLTKKAVQAKQFYDTNFSVTILSEKRRIIYNELLNK